MIEPQAKSVFIYCRVSTSDQVSGLESQVRTLTEYCQKQQIQNFQVFTDEGVSGAKISRPGLDQMMTMVRSGHATKVIVYSFSRFARSVTHLLSALEEFRALDVSFLSYTEQVDTNSPMGRAFFTVIAAISQLERELIIERVKNGLKNAKAKGIHIGRKKTRPSDLIQALLKSGMTLRATSKVANCSHGSVSPERSLMKQEAKVQRDAEAAKDMAVREGQLQVLDEAMPW